MPDPLEVGQSASMRRTVTEADVAAFAEVSGDHNPVHLDEQFAQGTRFKGRIAHGAFSVALISAALATHLPGPGAIYLSQTVRFLRPIRIGDEVTVTVTVTAIDPATNQVRLETLCANQRGKLLVEGEAIVLI